MEDLELKEVHSGEMKVSSEKNLKRKFKTPDQVEALEKFYSEHKYPTEYMKLQLAEKLGLTEKQVSGWFCHRRLKDKRLLKDEAYANGRQDHSSGVIQDLGSGHRQDSCGSTKQGDHWLVDPKEVDSRSFHQQSSPAANISHEHTEHYLGNSTRMDDTSSESSSPLHERFHSPRADPQRMKPPKYQIRNGVNATNDSRKTIDMGYKPSGYLKVKGQTENAAITAVKKQLGEHYREDGPPLGIEFEPLPPGAFESPTRDASPGPYYGGVPSRSPEINGKWRVPCVNTRDNAYSPIYREGTSINAGNIQECRDYQSHATFKQKHPFRSQPVSSTGLNSFSDMQEDSACHVSAYSGKKNYSVCSKNKEEMVSPSYDQHYPFVGRDTGISREHQVHEYAGIETKNVQGSEKLRVSSSKPKLRGGQLFAAEKSRPCKTEKEEKKYLGKMVATDYTEPVRTKKHLSKEIAMSKRVKTELPLQDYATKPSLQMRHSREIR